MLFCIKSSPNCRWSCRSWYLYIACFLFILMFTWQKHCIKAIVCNYWISMNVHYIQAIATKLIKPVISLSGCMVNCLIGILLWSCKCSKCHLVLLLKTFSRAVLWEEKRHHISHPHCTADIALCLHLHSKQEGLDAAWVKFGYRSIIDKWKTHDCKKCEKW